MISAAAALKSLKSLDVGKLKDLRVALKQTPHPTCSAVNLPGAQILTRTAAGPLLKREIAGFLWQL